MGRTPSNWHTGHMNNAKTDIQTWVGDNIRRFRHYKGLSQEDLAGLLGVSGSVIGKIETGRRNVSVVTLTRIATALEVDPGLLLAPPDERRR